MITIVLLLVLAGLAALFAYRSFQAGAPPMPEKAIEEAKRTKEAIEHPELETNAAPSRGRRRSSDAHPFT